MATRSRSVLALVCLVALAACQAGGTGPNDSNAVPSLGSSLSSNGLSSSQTLSFLKAAPRGVRTYVHLPLRNGSELDRLIRQESSRNSPMFHKFITPAQFRASYGPRASDLKATAEALQRA